MAINKFIHQMHKSLKALNVFERAAVRRWQKINPEWGHIFWDDSDLDELIKKSYPQFYDDYKNLDPVRKAGIQRLAVIHNTGGVYADCDCYPIKPLDSYLLETDTLVFGQLDHRMSDGPNGEQRPTVTDWQFYGNKGNRWMLDCMELCLKRCASSKRPNKKNNYHVMVNLVFDSVGIHAWNDSLKSVSDMRILSTPGVASQEKDWKGEGDKCLSYHFSTESWLYPHHRRWAEKGLDADEDARVSLETVERIYGKV
jgi:hypothetical protein